MNTTQEFNDDLEVPQTVEAPESRVPGNRVENLAHLSVAGEVLRTLPSEFVKRYRVLPPTVAGLTAVGRLARRPACFAFNRPTSALASASVLKVAS